MTYYVLTSDTLPDHRLSAFDPVDGEDPDIYQIALPKGSYTLTEVSDSVSMTGVHVSEKTRYAALLWKTNTGHFEIGLEGVLGIIRRTSVLSDLTIYGTDGQILYDHGKLDDAPNVLPPELFGLTPKVWWTPLKR